MSEQSTSVAVKIITLLLDDEINQHGIYSLSIDVAPIKHVEQVMKNRENEKYNCNKIIHSVSTEELLELQDGSCYITFKISGALKPQDSSEGQNVIQYSTKKDEIRRTIFLVHTKDGSAPTTTITFEKSDGKYLHAAVIKNMQTTQTQISSIDYQKRISADNKHAPMGGNTRFSSNTVPNLSSDEISDTEVQSESVKERAISSAESVPTCEVQSGRLVTELLVLSSGEGDIDSNVQAEPYAESQLEEEIERKMNESITARDSVSSLSSVSSVSSGSSVRSSVTSSSLTSSISSTSFTNQTDYGKILSNKSLLVLAGAVPRDGIRLALGLGVTHQAYQTHYTNNPHDVTNANYLALRDWRHEHSDSGEESLYRKLIDELVSMKRNDLKRKLEMVLKQGRELEEGDLK